MLFKVINVLKRKAREWWQNSGKVIGGRKRRDGIWQGHTGFERHIVMFLNWAVDIWISLYHNTFILYTYLTYLIIFFISVQCLILKL